MESVPPDVARGNPFESSESPSDGLLLTRCRVYGLNRAGRHSPKATSFYNHEVIETGNPEPVTR